MPREKHQTGWVEESGKRVKKWIGHWNPYRKSEDPKGEKRTHEIVDLGLRSELRKWEAKEKLRKHIERETNQRAKCDGDPTLQWFWDNAYLPSRTWGPAMTSTVTSIFTRHVLPKFGKTRIADLDKLELQKHLNTLAESFSRSLVKKILMQYRSVLEEAVEQEYVEKNQARKLAMPPTQKPCGRFLAMEEFEAIMAKLGFRDRLITRMFCTMGFRPGELFALRWDDIETGRIRVDESTSVWGMKEPKTAGSDAYLPMPPGVEVEMNLWRGMHSTVSPSSLVFPTDRGTAISPHNYERDVVVPAAIRAGIMTKPPKVREKGTPKRTKATAVNFQAFRRTFATWMQRTGATVRDVQGAMRHSSPDQTLKAYMREIPDSVRAAVDALDQMFTEHEKDAKTKPKELTQ
jgi:integrase